MFKPKTLDRRWFINLILCRLVLVMGVWWMVAAGTPGSDAEALSVSVVTTINDIRSGNLLDM